MQSLLLKLQADIESRKQPHWDISATAKSAILGVGICIFAFFLGISAAEGGEEGGTLMGRFAAPAHQGEVELQKAEIERLRRVTENSSTYGIPADLAQRIEEIALAEEIDPRLAFGLVATESEFNRRAVSPVGAVGYTQLMPSTAKYFRRDISRAELFDRDTNLRIGFRFLRTLIVKYDGNVKLALLAYNRGPEKVDSILRRGANPDNGYPALVMRDWSKTRRHR